MLTVNYKEIDFKCPACGEDFFRFVDYFYDGYEDRICIQFKCLTIFRTYRHSSYLILNGELKCSSDYFYDKKFETNLSWLELKELEAIECVRI